MTLVTSTGVFRKTYEGGYAIGAFNVNNMEIAQGIMEAAAELKSPVILRASAGARKYANSTCLVKLIEIAVELHPEIPIVLHLDHGADFATCKDCIDGGFTSVMIDCSGHSFEENIVETRKVVEYAHAHGVMVETELGTLAGVEDGVRVEEGMSSYARSEEVEKFVSCTGCGSLTIAIDTSHGVYKPKPGTKPQLRLDILEKMKKRLPGSLIVLHGASPIPQEYMKIIDTNGGQLEDAISIPGDQFRKVARSAVRKINIDSDLRLGMTVGIHQHFDEHPDHFDPRQYFGDDRVNAKAIVVHKIMEALGSNNRI